MGTLALSLGPTLLLTLTLTLHIFRTSANPNPNPMTLPPQEYNSAWEIYGLDFGLTWEGNGHVRSWMFDWNYGRVRVRVNLEV